MKKKIAIIVASSLATFVGLSVAGLALLDRELKIMDDKLGMAFDD